jgi:hypothetical protein
MSMLNVNIKTDQCQFSGPVYIGAEIHIGDAKYVVCNKDNVPLHFQSFLQTNIPSTRSVFCLFGAATRITYQSIHSVQVFVDGRRILPQICAHGVEQHLSFETCLFQAGTQPSGK